MGWITPTGQRIQILEAPAGRWVWNIFSINGALLLATSAEDYYNYASANRGVRRHYRRLLKELTTRDPEKPTDWRKIRCREGSKSIRPR